MSHHDDQGHHTGQNQEVYELFFSEDSDHQNEAKYEEEKCYVIIFAVFWLQLWKSENLEGQKDENNTDDTWNIAKTVLWVLLTEVSSQPYTAFIKVNTNSYRTKVTQNFHVGWVGTPDF